MKDLIWAFGMIVLVVILIIIMSSGCNKKSTTWESVGTFISCDVIPTSFNEAIKSRVETTEGVFIIKGVMSGRKGEIVYISNKGILSMAGKSGHKILGY